MRKLKYITFFTESLPNPALVGGKGLNLSKLGNIKATMPPGFIVNTNAYKKIIEKSSYHDQLIDLFSKNI
ncbi:MAG: PEP/pyruvate-binding domain-containing protein, partial [Promethearchaeota archaeon]